MDRTKFCECRRFVLLISAFVSKAVAGHIFAFPVYGNAIRRRFNISQLKYEGIASSTLLGFSLQIFPGLVFDQFGVRVSLFIGMIGTVCSYLLLLLAAYLPQYFQNNFIYLAFAHFLLAHSVCYIYIPAIAVCMASFPLRHKGKVIMLLDCGFQGAEGAFLGIYLAAFRNGHFYDEENQNIIGYFWFCSIFSILGFILAFLTVEKIPWNENEEFQPIIMDTMSDNTIPEEETVENTEKKSVFEEFKDCCCRIVRTRDFQILLWTCALSISAVSCVVSNTPTINRSLKISEHDLLVLCVPIVVSLLIRLTILPISDQYGSSPHLRSVLMCCTQFIGVISVIILLAPMRWGSELATVLSSRILLQLPVVGIYCMLPILISTLYDERHFGKLYGLVILGCYSFSFIQNLQFGALYEYAAQFQPHTNTTSSENRTFCFGDSCYRSGLIAVIVVMLIAFILCIVFTGSLWKKNSLNTTTEYTTNVNSGDEK